MTSNDYSVIDPPCLRTEAYSTLPSKLSLFLLTDIMHTTWLHSVTVSMETVNKKKLYWYWQHQRVYMKHQPNRSLKNIMVLSALVKIRETFLVF